MSDDPDQLGASRTGAEASSARAGRREDPRTERSTRALRVALLECLDRAGYRGVTIEGVAKQAGVAKTTIYRRWQSKPEMVFALAMVAADDLPKVRDTGSLRGDLSSLVERMLAFVGNEPGRSVLPGLIGDMAADEQLRDRFRRVFVLGARSVFDEVVARAVARGEVPAARATAAAPDLQALLLGTVFAWVHVMPEPVPADLPDRLIEQLLLAVNGRR